MKGSIHKNRSHAMFGPDAVDGGCQVPKHALQHEQKRQSNDVMSSAGQTSDASADIGTHCCQRCMHVYTSCIDIAESVSRPIRLPLPAPSCIPALDCSPRAQLDGTWTAKLALSCTYQKHLGGQLFQPLGKKKRLARCPQLSPHHASACTFHHPGTDFDCSISLTVVLSCRYQKHLGGQLFPPLGEKKRLARFPQLVPTRLQCRGDSWQLSSQDVAIAGLGWVAVAVNGPADLCVWAPPQVCLWSFLPSPCLSTPEIPLPMRATTPRC